MKNKDLTAERREAIFILKNENKTYAEFGKLIKISRLTGRAQLVFLKQLKCPRLVIETLS
jgi:hypothetical protein